MYKLVVLSAIFAAVAASPSGALFSTLGYTAPIAYSSVVAPGVTTIAQQASSVVHPPSFGYSAPLAYTHFIKKRSAPAIFAPSAYINTHLSAAPLTYTSSLAYSSPALVHNAPILSAAPLPYVGTHLIKKRSAPLLQGAILPAPYVPSAPLLTSAYAATPLVHSAPLVHSVPLVSSPIITPHYIKKRSAPFLASYVAPTAYSHQSRVDYTHTSPLISTTYSAPLTYSSPLAYTHVL